MPAWPICPRFEPLLPGLRILETRQEFPPGRTAAVLQPLVHEFQGWHRQEIAEPRRVRRYSRISGRGLRFRAGSRMPMLRHPRMWMTFPENEGHAPTVEDRLIGGREQPPA